MTKILNEGFDYQDLVNQVEPVLSVDEYSAKMGSDDQTVTLAFTLKSKQAAQDFVDWIERGYNWILDAQVSEGEISPGKYLVFAELNRRTSVPDRICEVIEDMETLTDLNISKWKININGEEYPADTNVIKNHIILSPQTYRERYPDEGDEELNEMRNIAQIESKNQSKHDSLIKDYMAKAGL